MSQPPAHDAPPPPPRPARPRPGLRGVWLGVLLMVLGVVVLVVGMVATWKPLFDADAVVAADGREHVVSLPAGEERGLWLREGEPATCTAVDADGDAVRFERPGGEYTVNEWRASNRFGTGAGDVVLTCDSPVPGTEVRISALPGVATVIVAMLLSCGIGIALGLGGLVLLVVTLVRRSRT
ncbi:hypothetical protein KUV85_02525 [Nocardioides panacisoli]|uniref:hypothetical protein n=1 Tax=Nocardioides panacisoli TaxID=627624 RepID=UPI001C6351B3|nr:hypothetical protein [Nocardioides panacisoli]QYJ04572.1 hypothetical protein KUV85_02525 [Nocardioides panacisoli]